MSVDEMSFASSAHVAGSAESDPEVEHLLGELVPAGSSFIGPGPKHARFRGPRVKIAVGLALLLECWKKLHALIAPETQRFERSKVRCV